MAESPHGALFLLLRLLGGGGWVGWVLALREESQMVSPGCGQQWAGGTGSCCSLGRVGQGGHGNSVTWTV